MSPLELANVLYVSYKGIIYSLCDTISPFSISYYFYFCILNLYLVIVSSKSCELFRLVTLSVLRAEKVDLDLEFDS